MGYKITKLYRDSNGILVNLVNHYRDPCELFHVTPLGRPGKVDVTSSSPKMPQASHGSVVYLGLNGKVMGMSCGGDNDQKDVFVFF